MKVQLHASLLGATQDAIHALLREYSWATNPAFFKAREVPENASKSLTVVASDPSGVVVGGLIAETRFAWLRVSIVVVAQEDCRSGVGRRLLQLAEEEAAARGCRFSYVDTMAYQAPEFYLKLGYMVVGKLDDWDSHGHAKLFLTKTLSS